MSGTVRIAGSVLLVGVLAPVGEAIACSCAQPVSACAVKDSGAVIFAGTALEVLRPADATVRRAGAPPVRVRFSVDESFQDAADATLEVATPADGPACGYPFVAGESYLVFAHRTAEGLQTGICTRTSQLAGAGDDLAVLRASSLGAVQSRLHGTAWLLVSRMDGTPMPAVVAGLPGIRVVVSAGSATHETTTDDRGEFRFLGLEPGQYTVRADAAAPFKPMFDRPVIADLDACAAEADLLMTAAALTGTVRWPDGSPGPRDVRVTAVVAGDVSASRSASAYTDAEGRWTIDGLGDGSYLVGINVFQAPSANSPISPVWYPGVADARTAQVIALRARPRQVDFTLPAPLALRTIRGVVLDATGGAVAGVTVSVFDGEFPDKEVGMATTDAEGRFTVEAVGGRRLAARARIFTRTGAVESETVAIASNAADTAISLTLSKPSDPRR